jgi:3-oxoacyl-[acyl-carrier-protein] synthase II
MPPMKVVLVACDLVTPYGWGIESCWNGLLSGRTAIGPFNRFGAESFQTRNAALVPDLSLDPSESLVMQMLRPMLGGKASVIPRDALLIMASTTGEIEILQEHVLSGSRDASGSCLDRLLNKVAKLIGVVAPGMVVSSACASSSMAIAVGAAAIRDGESDCVLVVACDSVSEFVFSGFSALMALDKDAARPFDRNRTGLSLGESAGYVLLMSSARALQENRPVMGEVAGWGLTNDANHMTGPSRDGSGLTMAIRKALEMADIPAETVGCVSAHGTGTPYNDSMEMKAFKQVFETEPIPVYSIKGGTGHTLGAAGLVEAIVAFKSLEAQCAPPTVNLVDVDDEARGWAAAELQPFRGETTISTNSGFGGVNCALVLKKREKDRSSDTSR